MNKRIRNIIAMALVVGTVAAFGPASSKNILGSFGPQSVYADAVSDVTDVSIEASSGSSMDLYEDDDFDDKFSGAPSKGDRYYAKTKKTGVRIDISGVDSDYVRIYKGSKDYKEGSKVPVSSGWNSLEVRIYSDKYEDYSSSEKKDSSNYEKFYIKVKSTASSSSSSDDDDDNDDDVYLSSISVDGYYIDNFDEKKKSYTYKVSDSTDSITVKAKPDDEDNDTVKIGDDNVYEDDKWKTDIDLKKGKNTIKIVVEDDDDNKRTYYLYVYRGTSEEVTSADDNDNGVKESNGGADNSQKDRKYYLDALKLDDGDTKVTLKDNVTEYNVKVDDNQDDIKIYAHPEYRDYVVKVNDETLDDEGDDKFKYTYEDLHDGINTIKIKVYKDDDEDDDECRTYTLHVYRNKNIPSSSNSTSTGNLESTTIQSGAPSAADAAVQIKNNWGKIMDGKIWQYYDANGVALKNQIKFINGAYYLFDQNGYLCENTWATFNGARYFAQNGGALKLGWFKVGTDYYYLDPANAAMRTGWIRDTDGIYYYLNSDGKMAHNCVIDGKYQLNGSGAYVHYVG